MKQTKAIILGYIQTTIKKLNE